MSPSLIRLRFHHLFQRASNLIMCEWASGLTLPHTTYCAHILIFYLFFDCPNLVCDRSFIPFRVSHSIFLHRIERAPNEPIHLHICWAQMKNFAFETKAMATATAAANLLVLCDNLVAVNAIFAFIQYDIASKINSIICALSAHTEIPKSRTKTEFQFKTKTTKMDVFFRFSFENIYLCLRCFGVVVWRLRTVYNTTNEIESLRALSIRLISALKGDWMNNMKSLDYIIIINCVMRDIKRE